jgi:hypothetical protein
MKNTILVFLVFITNILNAQSVNPETFPTVVGEIGNKNLYTNTGGEGKVSIKTIMDSVTSVSIPLSGTRVGEPVIGDIEIQDGVNIFPTVDGGGFYIGVRSKGCMVFSESGYFGVYNDFFSYPLFRGLTGNDDYTPNITDLDYTQKIYVDTKASKLGTDDIEITDFNKGVILTSPNGSRYRITVDNAGVLTTTIIP